MWWRGLLLVAVMVVTVDGKGKKHRHHKPGRAVLDRLSSTTVGEVMLTNAPTSRLLPAPLDVAVYASVETNATCGFAGSEEYCRDTPGKRGVLCDVCEGWEGAPSRRHPAAHALDGDPATWWQSPTLATGIDAHVELVASLPDKMELLHVIIKCGPSPRPLAWSLEVSGSDSGDSWRMIRAFGDREHCRRLWDLRPERRRRKARATKRNSKEKISCSTQFASPRPLENGEMHVAIGEGTTARRVRVSFRAPHPLPANQQYYTVRELTLAARCVCHGHADACRVDSRGAKCDCLHGTCGQHCQRCCNGAAWSEHSPCDDNKEDNVEVKDTEDAEGGAEECSCGERGLCEYDDTGAILCVNCTDNRAGPLCDRCLVGYYNAVTDGPCLRCDCDSEGSDGSCTYDNRLRFATCTCNPGFSGPRCDTCEDPSAVYPSCLVPSTTTPGCKCDPKGIVDVDRICEEVCECKVNVVGERCDACAPGHFGLSADLPQGCRPCYCSHRAASCVASTEAASDWPLAVEGAGGEAAGWQVTDLAQAEFVEPSIDDRGAAYIISYEVEGWESFFWLTQSFSGSQLSYYGGEVRASLYWGVVRGDTGGSPTVEPDVVLIAKDGTKLASTNSSHEYPGEIDLAVPLLEDAWYNMAEPSETIDKNRLMDVLANLKGVMIRAHFHADQDEVRLQSAVIAAGPAGTTEVCACVAGAAGTHCERCAWGHAQLHAQCMSCDCNGHAHCDSVGGPCGPCQHNTTGPHCERCLPGHYGNPVKGACKPCACPLFVPSNNFSPNCALAAAEGDEFVCTQCPDGYAGDHCELCDVGYWGSPTSVGGSCRACACGGAPCHPHTGDCLTCPPHAEGATCDQCQDGYWFGPGGTNASSCAPCACGGGALAAACDARTGQCACAPGHAGRACDTCDIGYGDISSGCPPCRCGPASLSPLCAPLSGACSCAPGAAPPRCDHCLPGYYDLTSEGCKGCNCSSLGSEGNSCDIRSGQCRCKPHVTGRACDTCEEGYWGLQLGECRRCECGAGAAACHPVSGLCACAAGVGGTRCDACLPGFYGFGPAGCLLCPNCEDGKVCSPETGRCICPPRTRGPKCQQCVPGYWRRGGRCVPCSCSSGAVSELCDATTGQCNCRIGWAGENCESCAPGYYGDRCRPCECNSAGSTGPCDEEGRCPCKENVVGTKCDTCLAGTFGLSAHNPLGCTACFCFGRSAHCTQAQLTRAALHVHAPAHVILQYDERLTNVDQDSLLSIHTKSPDSTISMPRPPVPVYYELGDRFLGDRVTSYGGILMFRVEEEGGEELDEETLRRFPLVRIYGKNLVLDHYERSIAKEGWHIVRLHESLWNVRGSARREGEAERWGGGATRGGVASRSALMLALQQVERIMLRVITRAPTLQDRVHALLLNVSLDTAIPGLSRSEPALGVELCDCPSKYAAASCQDPAAGFWMPPQTFHISEVAGTIIVNMEGEAQPCRCNGRATKCDPVTGHCINCTAGTAGPHCESCAAGHHGAPGAAGGCVPCPCPSRTRNYARACITHWGKVQCLCQPGYTGPDCAKCARGYYRSSNSSCAACACEARGAWGPECDAMGRCRCRPQMTGDKCDKCLARREFLGETGCTACDNCTQTLLDSIEHLTADLRQRADVTELSRIPKPFPAVLEFAHNASIAKQSLENAIKELETSNNVEDDISNLEDLKDRLLSKVVNLKTEAKKRDEEAMFLSLESMSGLDEAIKYRRKLGEKVMVLDEFARGEKHTSAHRALKEAKHLLRQIKEIKLIGYLASASDVSDSANLQSTAVQEYNYRLSDLSRRISSLMSRTETINNKSDDVTRLGEIVWSASDVIAELTKNVKGRLGAVRDIGLRCRLVLEDVATQFPQNLTTQTGYDLLSAQTLIRKFPSLTSELETLTSAAEEKEGILYELTPKYRVKYLKKVEEHVEKLGQKAKEYKSIFAGAAAASSSGVSAARAWSDVTDNVRAASLAADAATAAAAAAASLAAGPPSLRARAGGSEKVSVALKERAGELLKKSNELRAHLEQLRRGADVVSVALRGLGWQERDLAARPKAEVADILAAAGNHAERVFATTRALYDEASELRRKSRYNLRRQLAELQRHGDTALSAAQEHVSQIRSNIIRGEEVASALTAAAAARRQEHATAKAALAPVLEALKEKIARARHAADTISVSITSAPGAPAGCRRVYRVQVQSAAVSQVSVAVSFHGATVRDGTLLTALDDTDESTKRYMKLEVHNQQLLLTWDLGSGVGQILHPDVLQPTHDDGDHTTYRILIERIWSTVHLTIERTAHPPSVAFNSTSGATSLTPRRLYLGGMDDEEAGLPGCVHGLQMRDEVVGLWGGERGRSQGSCTGCPHRWWSSGAGRQSLSYFNGAGYAELRRSPLRPVNTKYFSIAFTFKTTDENAVLFVARDVNNNRSVSVLMRDCRVVFLVQYSSSQLQITAGGRHCTGAPAHVQAIRVFSTLEKGSLRVNGEETLGSPSPPVQSAAHVPDLTHAVYWVGGAPPAHPAPPAPPLLGCLGALTVDREGYDLMDTPTRHGVEAVCGNRPLYSAIFEGTGFIELASPQLRRKMALGLTFRSRGSDGLMLYRVPSAAGENEADDEDDGDDRHYLMVRMVQGTVEVVAAAGKAEVKLGTNGTRFDDKQLHSLRLVRQHKQLELWIDDEKLSSGALLGNSYPARSRGLFVGGAPRDARGARGAAGGGAQWPGFTGTLADLVLDANLLGLESNVRWSHARLGRRDPPRAPPPAAPRALHSAPDDARACAKTPSYTVEAGAAKFGDVPDSHARLRPNVKGADVTYSLHFRTFAPNGLILLAPGPKSKPKHYLALIVKDHKLRLVVRGRRRKEASLPGNVTDGTWRTVSVRVSRRGAVVSSGGTAAALHAAAARAHHLYIGGVPPPPPHTLPNSILKLGGLVGCVRRVSVNGRAQDLVRDAQAHRGLGQCAPAVEPGAHFAGDAYGVVSRWPGSGGSGGSAEWRLQFRAAAPSGVLLAAGAVTLQLRDGKVVLSRTSPSGTELSRAEWSGPGGVGGEGGVGACDGAWHLVSARVGRGAAALAVDGAAPVRADTTSLLEDEAEGDVPLYIGGLPEGSLDPSDSNKENFKGCIKDVSIGGHKREWTHMESLHNVQLDACPVTP